MTQYFNPRTKAMESREEMLERPADAETVLAIWEMPGKAWRDRYVMGADAGKETPQAPAC